MRTWLLLALTLTLASRPARACSCIPGYSALDGMKERDAAVFTGSILATFERNFVFYALVSVDRTWAGRPFSLTVVTSGPDNCDWHGVRGVEYLFVTQSERFANSTSICSGNERLAAGGATLAALGPGKPPVPLAIFYAPVLLALFVGLGLRLRRIKKRRAA